MYIFQEEKDNKEGWLPYLATASLGGISGFIKGGVFGSFIGLTSVITDKYLIKYDITNIHYITSYLFWSSSVFTPAASVLSNFLPNYKLPLNVASYIIAAIPAYLGNDFLDFRDKLGLPVEAFLSVNKLFDKKEVLSEKELNRIYNRLWEEPLKVPNIIFEDLKEIYNNDFLYNFLETNALNLAKILTNYAFYRYLLGPFDKNSFITNFIKENIQNSDLNNYLIKAGSIIITYAIKDFIETILNLKINSLNQKYVNIVSDKATEILVENGNGRKILAADQGKEIFSNITHDLWELIYAGSNNLVKIIEDYIYFLLSFSVINSTIPEALAPYSISLLPVQALLLKLSNDSKNTLEKLSSIESEMWGAKWDISENIEQINLRDGEEFVKYKYNKILTEYNRLSKESEYQTNAKTTIYSFEEIFNLSIDLVYFSSKYLFDNLDDLKEIPIIRKAISKIYSFLSSNLNFEIDNKSLIISKDRIDKLFAIIERNENLNLFRSFNSEDKIIFKDYSIELDNKKIVNIENLQFKLGEHYAITGKSGCGKTTMLIDLKEGLYGAVKSQGEISIPYIDDKEPKIMFIDQSLYLPKDATLLESIYFPNILDLNKKHEYNDLKEIVVDLFKELEIDNFINKEELEEKGLVFRLDSKEYKLSGGQAKKIAIIQAILNQPDILIMDETFTGLDKKSLYKVEEALNKYLPEALMLIVDHHAYDNNYNNFYDYEVNFNNVMIKPIEIESKYYNEI